MCRHRRRAIGLVVGPSRRATVPVPRSWSRRHGDSVTRTRTHWQGGGHAGRRRDHGVCGDGLYDPLSWTRDPGPAAPAGRAKRRPRHSSAPSGWHQTLPPSRSLLFPRWKVPSRPARARRPPRAASESTSRPRNTPAPCRARRHPCLFWPDGVPGARGKRPGWIPWSRDSRRRCYNCIPGLVTLYQP